MQATETTLHSTCTSSTPSSPSLLPSASSFTRNPMATLPDATHAHSTPTSTVKRVHRSPLVKQTSYVYAPPSHRLLYRGALSVPGSGLLLEGLSFTVPINNTRSPGVNLLENILALTLESMRGRTLTLSGTSRVDSVYLDKSGEVALDIHPAAILSRLYLENTLCSTPITAAEGTTDIGVRITLGDPDEEESSDILVYGQLPASGTPNSDLPSSSSSPSPSATASCLQLMAARILPNPPPPAVRLPRPDDPSPRLPPLISFGKKRLLDVDEEEADDAEEVDAIGSKKRKTSVLGRTLSRSSTLETDPNLRRARDVMTRIPKADGDFLRADDGPRSQSQPLSRAKSFNRAKSLKDVDVFKVPSLPLSVTAGGINSSTKGKAKIPDIVKELEKANKTSIKRAASDRLSNYGIDKNHPDFKEVWGFIYRGTEFALRSQMQTRALDGRTVDKIVRAHAEMYVHVPFLGSQDSLRSSRKDSHAGGGGVS
ncbi:hypothetical protein BV25DRAFT_1992891, partial [Artomyces pyxidatus]